MPKVKRERMISAWEPSHHLHKTTVSTRVFWLFHGLNTSSRALFSLSCFLSFSLFFPFSCFSSQKNVCCRACSIACLHTRSRGAAHLLFWRSPLKYNHRHQQQWTMNEPKYRSVQCVPAVLKDDVSRSSRLASIKDDQFLKYIFPSRRDISILTVRVSTPDLSYSFILMWPLLAPSLVPQLLERIFTTGSG